ncbi:hypothetical protein [Streptomyces canus]|uniref:hypothetical protein n=1 Tax=Streptomyces canus TaxID=58343 RepID=UPI0033A5ECD7
MAAAAAITSSKAEKPGRATEKHREAAERDALRAGQNPTARAVHTRNVLLRWAHRRYYEGDREPRCHGFMRSPDAAFEGIPLASGDLREALEYLVERELIELIHRVQWSDPGYRDIYSAQRISLTRLGMDCAESGMTVSEFLYPRPASPGDTYNTTFQAGAQGVQVGGQNTMHNSWGLEPQALLRFAESVLAKLPELGLAPADEAELTQQAATLRDEASAQQPNPTALRRAYQTVMNTLSGAPDSMASQWLCEVGTAAINNALGG